jgi:hypothetical protein
VPIHLAHLRWNSLTPSQLDALQALARDELDEPGCWSFTTRRRDCSLLGTARVGRGGEHARLLTGRLRSATAAEGLQPPAVALLTVSDLFAAGYRPRTTVSVPAPRCAEGQDDLVRS